MMDEYEDGRAEISILRFSPDQYRVGFTTDAEGDVDVTLTLADLNDLREKIDRMIGEAS